MMFFFVAPLWLGFTFYSLQNRPHLAASIETSAPLAVGHTQYVLPDLRDFPRVPVSHHQLLLGLAPPTATPVEEPSTQQLDSPPAHKLQHKHKHEQEQEHQEHEAGSVKVQGPRNNTVGTLPDSAPPTATLAQEPLATRLNSTSDDPQQKYKHEQEQEQERESDDGNEWQAQQDAVGASPDSDYVHKQIQAKPDDIPMMSTTFISQ
jgi:hypothetical protein